MQQSLGVIANLVSGGRADIRSLAWEKLRYQHCQAVRTALAEKYASATTNKMLLHVPYRWASGINAQPSGNT
jgi:hypothetical protein